jgi:pimeloyl-ACP methyl ester carboxylesterase
VPDYESPQSMNKYAYCINNPLKYIDPFGFDVYIVVGGSGSSKTTEGRNQWSDFLYSIGFGEGDMYRYVYDIDPEMKISWRFWEFHFYYDVGPRYNQLLDELRWAQNHRPDDPVHLIGFSEGAATIAVFLNKLTNGEDPVPGVSSRIRTAILLDVPKGWGRSVVVHGYDESVLVDLPSRLGSAGNDILCLNARSLLSIAQTGIIDSWGDHSMEYRRPEYPTTWSISHLVLNWSYYHNDVHNTTIVTDWLRDMMNKHSSN